MSNIAIVGPMHSGKTTFAKLLVDLGGYTRLGLADAVKDAAEYMLNTFLSYNIAYFPDRQDALGVSGQPPILLDRQEIEDAKDVFRPFLQWFGTDFARQYLRNDRCWIDMYLAQLPHVVGPVICDDVRFPNEADALREAGFLILRIVRDETVRLESIGTHRRSATRHSSETEGDSIRVDGTISNTGDVAALTRIAHQWLGLQAPGYAGLGDDTTR